MYFIFNSFWSFFYIISGLDEDLLESVVDLNNSWESHKSRFTSSSLSHLSSVTVTFFSISP